MKSEAKKIKMAVPAKGVMLTLGQHNADIKRYIGAVTEDFKHKVSAIAEQFLGLNEKLDAHTEQFVEVNKKLDEHSRILHEHSRKLDSHTEMIGQLMMDVTEVKVNMREKVSRKELSKYV